MSDLVLVLSRTVNNCADNLGNYFVQLTSWRSSCQNPKPIQVRTRGWEQCQNRANASIIVITNHFWHMTMACIEFAKNKVVCYTKNIVNTAIRCGNILVWFLFWVGASATPFWRHASNSIRCLPGLPSHKKHPPVLHSHLCTNTENIHNPLNIDNDNMQLFH